APGGPERLVSRRDARKTPKISQTSPSQVRKESCDFLMDTYEVTNRAFKAFLDSGGYRDIKYWKYPFLDDAGELSWEEALEKLKDKTGRPGPATWEAGDYPEGEDDYPVSGVSWY
ncbi:MAG: SUMF1/EgtB/PvdO family nonheme iron enzyme, partial [Candidatus Aminicenantes bacterium]